MLKNFKLSRKAGTFKAKEIHPGRIPVEVNGQQSIYSSGNAPGKEPAAQPIIKGKSEALVGWGSPDEYFSRCGVWVYQKVLLKIRPFVSIDRTANKFRQRHLADKGIGIIVYVTLKIRIH